MGIMPYVGTGVSRAAGGAAYGGIESQARNRDLLKRERARMGTGDARGSLVSLLSPAALNTPDSIDDDESLKLEHEGHCRYSSRS